MSCVSGGVKVDHACSGPNSGPMVTSFGFENRPLRLSSLECGLARARCPSNVAPGSPSRSRTTGMCDASGASSVQLTSTAHGLAAMISTTAFGLGARFTCHDIQPLPDEVEFLAAGLVDHMHVVLVPILLGRGVRLWDGLESLEKDYQQLRSGSWQGSMAAASPAGISAARVDLVRRCLRAQVLDASAAGHCPVCQVRRATRTRPAAQQGVKP
jgi:hypothetical protein